MKSYGFCPVFSMYGYVCELEAGESLTFRDGKTASGPVLVRFTYNGDKELGPEEMAARTTNHYFYEGAERPIYNLEEKGARKAWARLIDEDRLPEWKAYQKARPPFAVLRNPGEEAYPWTPDGYKMANVREMSRATFLLVREDVWERQFTGPHSELYTWGLQEWEYSEPGDYRWVASI